MGYYPDNWTDKELAELEKRIKSSKAKDNVVEITAKMDQSWRR